ncbi:hypothetical protein DFP72DRAFT_905093 [Ephemerocybe angulata]|uniref:Uncharacterized protein n=1 Tax=Ephemerocybe angulata TaxID=980116 RepID=A0A8H6HTN2_9AGAR|nr:hypothetical protein DFP72DRAFT_905093 [Tulosesus angulatus]
MSHDDIYSDGDAFMDHSTDNKGGDSMSTSSPDSELQYPTEDMPMEPQPTQAQALVTRVYSPPVPSCSMPEHDTLRNDLRLSRDDVSALEHDLEGFRVTLRERDAEIAELRDYKNRADAHMRWMDRELDDARADTRGVRERAELHAQHAQRVEGSLRESLRESESALAKAKKLLGARTEELTVAQAFMVTADKFSVADVSRLVEQLNDDAYQCAVMVSDAVLAQREALEGRDLQEDTEEERKYVREARQLVVSVWGEDVVGRYEADIKKDGDTFLFETVVQSALVMRMKDIMQRMYLGKLEGVNKVLVNMWEGIKKTHENSIAKNWLSMMHTQLKGQRVENEDTLRRLVSLTCTAGYRIRDDGSPGSDLPVRLQGKLEEMTQKALKIKEMAAEGVLSAEIEVFAPKSRRSFDPEWMEDAFAFEARGSSTVVHDTKGKAKEKGETKAPIVVSTGLGVQCCLKGRSEVALKCKVLLQSALETPERDGIAAMPGIEPPD